MGYFSKISFKKIFNNLGNFRIILVVNLLLQSLVVFDAISCVIDGFILIWAIFLFKNKIFQSGNLLKINYFELLLFFILSSLVTAVLHINIKFPFNFLFEIFMILYFSVCFFIFYGMHANVSKDLLEKESTRIFKIFVFFNTFLILVSFILVLIKRQIVISGNFFNSYFKYVVGIYTVTGVQRFTGLYENPNILAFCSVVSLIFIHMLFTKKEFLKKQKKIWRFVLLFLFLSLNFLALMLSDSIASFLLLTIYVILVLFGKYLSSSEKSNVRQRLKNLFIFVINTFFVIIILMFARQSLQEGASSVISNISLDGSCDPSLTDVNFGRIAYSLSDGNGRLELLKEAIEIFKKNPFFGIGTANIEYYGKLYFGGAMKFFNFHNGYVSVLACYGIIGFLPFIAFWFTMGLRLVGFLLGNVGKRDLSVFPHCVCIVLAYLVYAVSEKTMLSELNLMGVFIWLILGYAWSYRKLYLVGQSNFC